MEITEVKVFLVNEEKLKAFVSIVVDRCFMVNDIKVIKGREGLFISMPSRRKKNGEFKDVAHPLNNETRSWMEERILGEYQAMLGQKEASESRPLGPKAVDRSSNGAISLKKNLDRVQQEHLSDSYWSVG